MPVPCILFPKALAFLRWGSQRRFREVRKSLEGTKLVTVCLPDGSQVRPERTRKLTSLHPCTQRVAVWPTEGEILPSPGAWVQPPQLPPCSDPALPEDDVGNRSSPTACSPCHNFLPPRSGPTGSAPLLRTGSSTLAFRAHGVFHTHHLIHSHPIWDSKAGSYCPYATDKKVAVPGGLGKSCSGVCACVPVCVHLHACVRVCMCLCVW